MTNTKNHVPWTKRIAYFFPIQLILVHLKKNQVLLLFWLLLFGFITKNVASNYGAHYLFLNPEYLNKVGFLSYFIVGFSCGGFIMAFNISSFIINGFRFPFVATLSNSFLKYCLNNFIIPVTFLIVYSFKIYSFQSDDQFSDSLQIFLSIFGFLSGVFSFLILSLTYFFSINKDIFGLFGVKTDEEEEIPRIITTRVTLRKNNDWKRLSSKEGRDWHVDTYISNFRRLRRARDIGHYDKEMLLKVFRNNHTNAALFEFIVVATILILGIFRENPLFLIPASASLFLIFTMYLMLFSALHTWLRGWATTVTILLFVSFNYLFSLPGFYPASKAFGLNYKGKQAEFSYKNLEKYNCESDILNKDFENTIYILNKWRLKNSINSIYRKRKPKMVLINTSGGGLRSSLWTYHVMQTADSILKGELMKHTQLITGASGGMIGAAFYRELYYLYEQNKLSSYHSSEFSKNISKDLLNPLIYYAAINDLFLRLGEFSDGKYTYKKDRGYAFEKSLNENTANIFNKRLGDYFLPEKESHIPMMIFSPTLVNDGRKMYISPQGISYVTQYFDSDSISRTASIDGIEFLKFFKEQDANNLRFASVMRMSATFPFVTPFVQLPSEPAIEVMDAGARDNFGLETSLKFLYTFRNWISSNTSGVIIIQIRDRFKKAPIEGEGNKSLVQTLSTPLGALYGNLFSIQDYNNDGLYQYASRWYDGKIDVVEFQLKNQKPDNISLSWHLTNKEKMKVIESLKNEENEKALKKLVEMLQ
jgi:hypothetical protein